MVLYENETETKPEIEIVNGMSLRVLESCHSLWVFEPDRKRFRRVPRGTRLDIPSPESEWTAYHRLEVEPSSGAFAVALTADGTRVLRSWLHSDPCRHCGADQTTELSLEAIRRTV